MSVNTYETQPTDQDEDWGNPLTLFANNVLCTDDVTVGPCDNIPTLCIDGLTIYNVYCTYVHCSDIGWQWNDLTILLSHWPFPLCADNQTLTHNQNILPPPQVQYTAQCNQISRTQNITKQHPRNKNQTKPTLLGLRQDAFTVIGL